MKKLLSKILFVFMLSITSMYANKVSDFEVLDFYNNLDQESKKAAYELYGTDQLTLEQKRQIYSLYEAEQEGKRKTGKSVNERINDFLELAEKSIEEVLKDEYIIKEYKSLKNTKIDFSYKEGMLKECLVKLGEENSFGFLVLVYTILDKINKKISKQSQALVVDKFKDILFMSIHYYYNKIFTSNNLIDKLKDFSKLVDRAKF
ncbi:DUF643 domain-containing protein [Borreliella burgdorferi]|uniref:Uncharacterized protein n=2 Tax=Borreliella burgdorferi TaxID=139 RepID=A0A0H3C1V6_BORBZ|nr:DUF643 domain-containing protein [Borreliella burgdorferi]ACK75241.1 conserved hypothetical protein [Borreliella burgdorferi ZS7]ACN23957.1 conserved hypothetical protein [Borreliella burgdorferi 64b]MCS2182246.1 DUF643 domain-containing protein [Borreliella burgdorferi]